MLVHLGRVGVRSVSQPPFQKALATARRIGASLFAVPDNYAGSLYQDSTGVTPVSTVGQLVGLMLDSTATAGADIAGSGFTDTPGWSFAGGVLTALGASPFSTSARSGFAGMQANRSYRVTYTVNVIAGTFRFQLFGTAAQNTTQVVASGTYSEVITPSEVKGALNAQAGSAGFTGSVTGVSVKEITGTHASQATTANKPTLGRGLYNLLTWSNDRANGAWFGANFTANNATTLTLGAGGAYQVNQAVGLAGNTYTQGCILSGTPGQQVTFYLQDNGASYAMTSSVITLTATPTLYAVSRTMTVNGILCGVSCENAITITIGGTGLFAGTLTAAQILANGGIPVTTSAAGWNQTAGRYLLDFGQTNTSRTMLFTPPAITTQATLVWAGAINNLSNYPCLFGQGAGGAQVMLGPSGAVTLSKVGAAMDVTSPGGSIQNGTPFVVACTINVGGTSTIRVNGVQIGSGSQITSALTATAMARMSNGSGAGFAAGYEGFSEVSNTILSLADLQAAERAAAKSVGVTLP